MKYKTIGENHLFSKAYAKGKKVVCRNVIFYVLGDRHAGLLQKRHPQRKKINRTGITVSKKYGGAVQRNRAKRIVREAWRLLCKNREVAVGYLVVICIRDAAKEAKTADIYRDIEYATRKTGLLV